MKLSTAELAFRGFLDTQMRGSWLFTWHEDREISPGVPDLHYVMVEEGHQYRAGWLELKATNKKISNSNTIKVEPSQHQYIRRWCTHMPIHFAVRVLDMIYIIPGRYHRELAMAKSEVDIAVLADLRVRAENLGAELPIFLKKITAI